MKQSKTIIEGIGEELGGRYLPDTIIKGIVTDYEDFEGRKCHIEWVDCPHPNIQRCDECSLSNYGRNCQNKVINPNDGIAW